MGAEASEHSAFAIQVEALSRRIRFPDGQSLDKNSKASPGTPPVFFFSDRQGLRLLHIDRYLSKASDVVGALAMPTVLAVTSNDADCFACSGKSLKLNWDFRLRLFPKCDNP